MERGGAGGHRGIASIISQLHTEEFLRVKLGIGRPPPPMPAENFVLSHFPADEAEDVAQFIERAAAAVDCLVREGLQEAQNRFHGSNDLGENGEKGKRGKGKRIKTSRSCLPLVPISPFRLLPPGCFN